MAYDDGTELTYQQHIEAKKDTAVKQYRERVDVICRHIEYTLKDFNSDGVLTDDFFARDDLGMIKRDTLFELTKVIKKQLEKLK